MKAKFNKKHKIFQVEASMYLTLIPDICTIFNEEEAKLTK